MIKEKNPIIAKAEAKRKYLTGKAAEERLQELIEKGRRDEVAIRDRCIEIGEERGRKEGKLETLTETARKMLKDNLNKNIIIKYTGLTEKEIDKIAEAM